MTWSITSRSGSETFATGIDVVPFESLIAPAGPAAATTPVAPDVAVLEPNALLPVTATRRRCPTSPDVALYVAPVAPGMLWQLLPLASHLCHWYA